MRGLLTVGRAPGRSSILMRWPFHQRCIRAHYRIDGAPMTVPVSPASTAMAQLDGLALTQLTRPLGVMDGEPLRTLTQLAETTQSCQVLETMSNTALALRDAAFAASHGTGSPHSAGIGLQALFQNGYDTLVALVQALPQCSSAYGPAAVIPETCVTLFHVHNLLLQAAYASQQEFDVWTELMQAGLELYLRKAPRHIVTFSSAQLEPILDAFAHQDLWQLQRLLWQRMLAHIPSWDSLQDFCSAIRSCELTATAAATAAAAAAAGPLGGCGGGGSMNMLRTSAGGSGAVAVESSSPRSRSSSSSEKGKDSEAPSEMEKGVAAIAPDSSDAFSFLPWAVAAAAAAVEPSGKGDRVAGAPSSAALLSFGLGLPSVVADVDQTHPFLDLTTKPQASAAPGCHWALVDDAPADDPCRPFFAVPQQPQPMTPATGTDACSASALYEKQMELVEYGILMSDCIRTALEGAAVRGLAAAPQPHAAARQLVDVVAAFDARQRSGSSAATAATAALRYAFTPTPEWLSRVAAAGVRQGGERLKAAQVVRLLQDLDALPPQPSSDFHRGIAAPSRWLNAAGQAAVESATVHQIATQAWSPNQAISVIKALTGKCSASPGDSFCGLTESLLLGCTEARQDVDLLCAVLQEAIEVASWSSSSPFSGGVAASSSSLSASPSPSAAAAAASALTAAHLSLVKAALNRASYLIESTAPSTGCSAAAAATAEAAESEASTSGSGNAWAVVGSPHHVLWRSREFLFERYPRLLQAARSFGYPLQAFRLDEYSDELYNQLATCPGHELVAVGPEGLALVLQAVASSPCCRNPQWAAAFERACLMLLSVQFSVGYTHPKRWLGLLEATVNSLPLPMPALAAGIRALLVRLCDTRLHAKYFWQLLPLVGALERRAAAAVAGAGGVWSQPHPYHHPHPHHHCNATTLSHRNRSQPGSAAALTRIPTSSSSSGGHSGPTQASAAAGMSCRGGSGDTAPRRRAHRQGSGYSASAHRSFASTVQAGRSGGTGASSSNINGGAAAAASHLGAVTSSISSDGGGLRPVLPPPDISKHYVSEEEYSRWCEDLGQRLALSMACLSDQERVAQLSVLGIVTAGS